MKVFVSLLCFVLFSTLIRSQNVDKETSKIATFCKVWGFLKYYHPAVGTGKIDWDSCFVSRIQTLPSLKTKKEISNFYIDWLNSLGTVNTCAECKSDQPDSTKINLNLYWLNDTMALSNEVVTRLQFIRDNRFQGENYYVHQIKGLGNTTYKNEKEYNDSVFPTQSLRLLGLSRYWNIINYYYPYTYVIGEDWNKVLLEMIPKFKDPKDTIDYHLAMLEIVTKINDSHAFFITHYTNQYFGYKWAPFDFKIIDNKAIVTTLYNDSLCKIDDIKINDVFLSVDNMSIEAILKKNSKYIPASNYSIKLRNCYHAIFNGSTDSISVKFERSDIIQEKVIHRYYFKKFEYKWKEPESLGLWKILDGNIGYVNMGLLDPNEVNRVLKKLKKTKAIIFDVRNYPNETMYAISKFLNPNKVPFVKFTIPDMTYPGIIKFEPEYYCGRTNKNYYKGKVVVLFNEYSQSHSEFTIMALQTAPDVTCIGSQTAGADGNVSTFKFPGGYETMMTGLGIYYPDWKETQRIGMVPDIEVKPTIEGIRIGKDEVLDKAIEFINSNEVR
jgi:carboxyl-terminal processing protease